MNNRNRKPLIGLIALSAALAMPMAFAQSETEEAAHAADRATGTDRSHHPPTESATGASVQATEQATGAASSGAKQGWADVDTDKDGAISKQEASSNAGLSQVFDQADATPTAS